jgi:hypothetical protein
MNGSSFLAPKHQSFLPVTDATNVEPQSSVQKARASSALRRLGREAIVLGMFKAWKP